MAHDETGVVAGAGYPWGELAKAATTATRHHDPRTRERAEERLRGWRAVLAGMASGLVRVGSRAPVVGLPAWVTPQVLRGGFATGQAAAGGPLHPHEVALADRLGIAPTRSALFDYTLTAEGLAELDAQLDAGAYRIELPEEAALLVAVWLLRAGHQEQASTLVQTIVPFADRLRFTPVPGRIPTLGPGIVWRETTAEVGAALTRRGPNPRVEAMNEALTIWNPFADKLLGLWLETIVDERVAAAFPDQWAARATALLDEYERLATKHRHCSKHRRRKENLAILRVALEQTLADGLTSRQRGWLQRAVDTMVHRRGRPGAEQHTALRQRQLALARRPTYEALARTVAGRLAEHPTDVGLSSVDEVLRPVDTTEIPDPIRRVVQRAQAGRIEALVAAGRIPSAEVLAALVPQVAAEATAAAYPEPALRILMAAHYCAFRNRRSLLLLNLEHQVRLEELPWVAALARVRLANAGSQRESGAALEQVGQLTLETFPATLLPNPLISELSVLSREAGLNLPWVEELAADIFMGTFSLKFVRAAQLAAALLDGSVYQRYYDIDYSTLTAIDITRAERTSKTFDDLCHARAGRAAEHRWSVAANGMVIEQAQILTTHNLATLAGPVAIVPTVGWANLAQQSFETMVHRLARATVTPQPLASLKDAAYAWRHTLFHLSLSDSAAQAAFLDWARERASGPQRTALGSIVDGLAYVMAGGSLTDDGDRRRFLGWTTSRHWLSAMDD